MTDKSKHDVASDLAYLAAETELREHVNDALDTELCVHIQPLTITRLDRYREGTGQSRDVVVNMILHEWLYGEGE